MWRRVHRDERSDEAGFSLVEVILAMVIIAGVLATMLGFVVQSLTTIAQARQRQTATALATQAMEEMRALPYDTITLNHATAVPDASAVYAVLDAGKYYLRTTLPNLALNEQLVVNNISGRTQDTTVDEVRYRVHKYVTLAPNNSFNLTVLVTYTSTVSHGQRVTAQRSVAFSPAGCLSTAQNPFAAPCQPYYTANAGQALGGISVVNPTDASQPIPGFADSSGTLLEITLASNGTSVMVEQTASANASALTSGARQESTVAGSSGGVSSAAAVDSDPSSTPDQQEIGTISGQTSSAQSLTGTAGTLSVNPGAGDNGQAAAAIYADSTYCTGTSGSGLATGPDATHLRPCAASRVSGNTSTAALTYEPKFGGGFESMSLPIVTIAAASTPARALAAQIAQPNVDVCTGPPGSPSGNGCAYAAATRTLGQVRIGALSGGVGPAGMTDGVIVLSGLTESVRAEEGVGGRAPAYTRAGTLKVWNGTSYTTVALTPTSSGSTPVLADVVYTAPSGKKVTLHYEGTVTLSAAQLVRTPATRTGNLVTDCKAQACVSQYNGGGGVMVSLTVTVIDQTTGAESGRFGIAADLGGLVGQATYKEAADA